MRAWRAAALLLLTPGFIACGRYVVLDSLFSCLVGLTLFCGQDALAQRMREGMDRMRESYLPHRERIELAAPATGASKDRE